MRIIGRSAACFGLMALMALTLVFSLQAQQAPPPPAPQASPEPEAERVIPAPKDVRESSGIWFFLGWVWLSILVLAYFLRLKIREADRLYRLKFYSPPEK